MQINITREEYEVLQEIYSEIGTDCEGGVSQEYIDNADYKSPKIKSIIHKYDAAYSKQALLKKVKREVRRRNGFMPDKLISKLARQVIKDSNAEKI